MSKSSRTGKPGKASAKKRRGTAGPIAFFVSLFIVALGTIQLVSTFHTYALNLAELNGLKREEASLVAKKQELENDIKRWDDKAYVTAQARERLGFVFPGEQAVRVLHPEAVTGTEPKEESAGQEGEPDKKVLPWYSELAYAFKKADEPVDAAKAGTADAGKQSGTEGQSGSGKQSSGTDDKKTAQDGQQTTQQNDQQNTGEGTRQ